MDKNPDHMAARSMDCNSLGLYMIVGGILVTFGTYGFGIIMGLPLMLMGVAYPLWRHSLMRERAETLPHQRQGGEMTQKQAADSGGVVMSREEAQQVVQAAQQQTRERLRMK